MPRDFFQPDKIIAFQPKRVTRGTTGTGPFRFLPVRVEKRSGPLNKLFEPIGAVGRIVCRLKVPPLGVKQFFGRRGVECRQRLAKTQCTIMARRTRGEALPAGCVHNDVVEFLKPKRVLFGGPYERELEQRRTVQRYRPTHLALHPNLSGGERIFLFAKIEQGQIKSRIVRPRRQAQAGIFRHGLPQCSFEEIKSQRPRNRNKLGGAIDRLPRIKLLLQPDGRLKGSEVRGQNERHLSPAMDTVCLK